jgi:methionyl-tRNA formyltransferase
MKKTSEPIAFFGSGPVAAESLRLLSQDFVIETVITKPRPPHHKGDVPVLALSEELGLPVLTAKNKESLDELFADRLVKSRLAVLVDFGIIVSKKVIDYFPLGIVNSHFSLLPEWRGADPITFALLSGQRTTGVSLMLLVPAMDEGPLLAQAPLVIEPQMTTPELTAELVELSYKTLHEVLPLYLAGKAQPADQLSATMAERNKPTYSRRLTKDDGLLDWHKPAAQLEREIRAYLEWPKSRSIFGTLEVTITKAHVLEAQGKPGQTTIINKQPVVYCGGQALVIERLKPAGKKEMTGEAFLAGYKNLFQKA